MICANNLQSNSNLEVDHTTKRTLVATKIEINHKKKHYSLDKTQLNLKLTL